MPPAHQLEFDASFEQIGELSCAIQDEIGEVLRGLEIDPFFDPGDEYVVQQDNQTGAFICQHVRGWDGWQIGWWFEYGAYVSYPQIVVIFLYMVPEGGSYIELNAGQEFGTTATDVTRQPAEPTVSAK